MFSERDNMKTENEMRTEIPSDIFSPWSGGERKVVRVRELSIAHGRTKFMV